MQVNVQRKEFSAERQHRLRQNGTSGYDRAFSTSSNGSHGGASMAEDPSGATNAELLQAIRDLTQMMRLSHPELAGQAPSEEDMPEDESQDVRLEIGMMVRAIAQAKGELASIKHPMAEDDRIVAASSELDAIVEATESATNQILEANEAIESEINKIAKTHHDDDQVMVMVDKIAEYSIRILEASNFQDITGQRVTKVVKTIHFIEERILAMIDIWGVEAFAELPVPQTGGPDDEEGLMNGPQLGNAGISQDEIDALFD